MSRSNPKKVLANRNSIAIVTFITLSLFPAVLRGAPSVSVSLSPPLILPNKIFSCELTVSWEGDPERYLFAPPRPTLPDGIEEEGSSFKSSSSEGLCHLYYTYELRAEKEGEYVLKPFTISYWEKGTGKEETLETEALPFTVSPAQGMPSSYWLAMLLIIMALSLFVGLFVLYKKKKRRKGSQSEEMPITRESVAQELEQCNAYRIRGDWENYLKKVMFLRNKLPRMDQEALNIQQLDTLTEKVTYGGVQPRTEEIALIQRQLEMACKRAFPDNKENELEGIKFQ
jgi:hypothetical protein